MDYRQLFGVINYASFALYSTKAAKNSVFFLSAIVTIWASSCGSKDTEPRKPSTDNVRHEFIAHPDTPACKVEFYWSAPRNEQAKEKMPACVFIHGHQDGKRQGGKDFVDWGVLQTMADSGYVAIAVSQPGYGESGGEPDFCGRLSQHAVEAVIEHFRRGGIIDPHKIAIEGISRGALIAGMIATRDTTLSALVLISGLYDVTNIFSTTAGDLSFFARKETQNILMHQSRQEAINERSLMFHTEKIRTPTLILNGANDERTNPEQSKALAKKISSAGIYAKALIYKGYGHNIPYKLRNEDILPFLKQYLWTRK